MLNLFRNLSLGLAFLFLSAAAPAQDTSSVVPLTQEVNMPSYEGAFLKMFLTLIGLLIAIFFTVFILKRLSKGRLNQNHDVIKILEKRALSAKTMLYLIEVGEKQTLIAESQLEIKPITSVDILPVEEES